MPAPRRSSLRAAVAVCALGLASSLAGCSSDSRLLDADLPDTRRPDVVRVMDEGPSGPDEGTPDVPAPTDVRDASGRCTANAECAATATTPVCDTASGSCVACTPTDDRCPAGQYCTTGNRCAPGCRDDASCAMGGGAPIADAGADAGGDAGSGGMRCDMTRRVCVGCRGDSDCAPGFLCGAGSACVPGCTPTRACPGGETCCSGVCLATQGDVSNCGACGNACMLTNAVAACTAGACAVMSCRDGFGNCDGNAANGCETDTLRTAMHCGACNMACAAGPNSTSVCEAGRCALRCNDGFGDCDGNAANGCEVNLRTSAQHCGMCGVVCAASPNSTPACMNRACRPMCAAGFSDCDMVPATGCETATQSDARNCGTCGTVCPSRPNATPTCATGTCGIECAPGFENCNGDATDGCEADLRGTSNCGRCGVRCEGATPLCSATATSFACSSGCTAGQTRCGSSCTTTATDPQNCGACGTDCPSRANSTRTCAAGACGIACNSGFADCDMSAATGCESVLATDMNNCGRCGNRCTALPNAVVECRAGGCAIASCVAGFADCDGVASNGCEVTLATSAANCGRCGNACSSNNIATPVCSAGMCGGTCTAGFADCDGDRGNGCEANLGSDPRNCNACGTVCSTGVCGARLSASMSMMPRDWSFNRDARYDATAATGVLTTATTSQTGSLFYVNSVSVDRFTATFEFRIGGGTRADGMAFVLQRTGATAVGAQGGGLGAVGLNGFMVELDDFNNNTCGDTNGSHVGVDTLEVCDPGVNTPTPIATGPDFTGDIANSTWRTCVVSFDNGRVSVTVDGAAQVTNAMVPGFTAGTRYWVGFSGATGGLTNRHEVRNVRVDFPTARCL